MENAVILIQCPDQKGIVARISEFVFRYDGNIIQSDQYSTDPQNGRFFLRLAFCFDPDTVPHAHLEGELAILARSLQASWSIHYESVTMRMGILVSKQDHCLLDLLYRRRSGELQVDIPFVISNHPDAGDLVRQFGVPFHHVAVLPEDKRGAEDAIVKLTGQATDFLVLARYMQILSPEFLSEYGKPIINIHHSFLPSFKGANPYRQAHDRGVKVIGATAHYVTADLDEGPIIDQVVERVSHRYNVSDMMRKGKNLEKTALANAVQAHIEHRVIRFRNKTIVFD